MIARRTLQRDGFRFELRPYDESWVPSVLEAVLESKAHVAPWMAWLHRDYRAEDAHEWTLDAMRAWDEDRSYEFVIFDREDGAVAGCAGLNALNHKDHVGNLGYWVRATKLRCGAARQAAELLAEFGFAEIGLNRIEIVVAVGNVASQRVAERVGALFEGVQRQRIAVGKTVHDARMYALLRAL